MHRNPGRRQLKLNGGIATDGIDRRTSPPLCPRLKPRCAKLRFTMHTILSVGGGRARTAYRKPRGPESITVHPWSEDGTTFSFRTGTAIQSPDDRSPSIFPTSHGIISRFAAAPGESST